MSAKAIAAAIALLITPVIARLFDPRDFGVAAVWVSSCALLSHVSSLKYEVAIMLPAKEEEADQLYSLALRILLVFVGVVAVVSAIAAFVPFGDSSAVGEHDWLLWLAPGVLLYGLVSIQESWLSRRQKFSAIGESMIAGTSFTGASRVTWGAELLDEPFDARLDFRPFFFDRGRPIVVGGGRVGRQDQSRKCHAEDSRQVPC
jgi:O-antigen/teichoic acid export membrane protein